MGEKVVNKKKKDKFTKKEWYWILYDVGNSAFTMVSVSLFALFFGLMTDEANLETWQSDSIWSYATSVITLIAVLIGPLIGSSSDYKGFKKPMFLIFTIISCLACIALGIPMHYMAWIIAFVVAKVAYNGALMIYDSMLVDVTTDERSNKVSSYGYALGYIGSLVPFLIGLVIVAFGFTNYEAYGSNDELLTGMDASLACPSGYLICFIINALWWIGFTIPLFSVYKQKYYIEPLKRKGSKVGHFFKNIGHAYVRIYEVFKYAKKYKGIILFLIAFFLYIDGVYSIIELAIKVSESFGVNQVMSLAALVAVQVIAFPSAIGIAYLSKKFGTVPMIFVCIIGYLFITIFAIFINSDWMFWVLAIFVGFFQGGIQSLSRSYFTQIIPKNKSGELFSLFDAFGKGASFLGTFLFATINTATQNANISIIPLSCLVFAGGILFIFAAKANKDNRHLIEEENRRIEEELKITPETKNEVVVETE